jgi:flagellar hook-associated protein 1 FlgK
MHLAAVVVPDVDVGLGVETLSIERVRDLFVDFQIRTESHISGRLETTAESLRLAENVFLEPGAGGFNNVLSSFFNAWRDVSNAPEVPAPRASVVQSAETLSGAMKRMHASLTSLRGDADARLRMSTVEVNNLTAELASLNEKIIERVALGDPANDLMDKRDLALDRLSQMLDMQYIQLEGGRIDVFIGGRALVAGTQNREIYASPNILNNNYVDVKFVSDDAPVQIGGGEMRGLLDQRDVNLPNVIGELNALAAQFITDINAVHTAGFALDGVTTGTAFFTGTDATDIAVNAAVVADVDLVAAAQLPGAPGDASNALAIADLQNAATLLPGGTTYGEYYQGSVTRLGALTRETEWPA